MALFLLSSCPSYVAGSDIEIRNDAGVVISTHR